MRLEKFLPFLVYLNCLKAVFSDDICESNLCQCSADTANCHKRNLLQIEDILVIPEYIVKIDFSENGLSSIDDLNIEVIPDGLESLDLSSNVFEELPPQSLQSFNKSMKTLRLKNNIINILQNETFGDLGTLVELILSFNRITSLPDGIFDALIHLENLDLSFNPIQSLNEMTFRNLKKLKKLNLSFLQLSQIHLAIFDWNLTITHLDFSHNYFTSVPRKAFWYLRNTLQELEFSGNLLKTLPSGSFFGLRHLKVLRMEQLLHLRRIEAYAFRDLESLETFKFRYLPKIRNIDAKAFHLVETTDENLLCPLRDFIVEFSTLPNLPEALLHWDQMRYASFRSNRWICDCHMKWMKGSSLENLTGNTIYCAGPFQYRGRNIKSLQEQDFTCIFLSVNSKSGAVILLVIVVIAMLISFTTVILLVYRRNGWICNPPRLQYDKVDSPLNTITIYDRSSVVSTGSESNNREMVRIRDS